MKPRIVGLFTGKEQVKKFLADGYNREEFICANKDAICFQKQWMGKTKDPLIINHRLTLAMISGVLPELVGIVQLRHYLGEPPTRLFRR